MSSNIIIYLLLYRIVSQVLVQCCTTNILGNISGYFSFRWKHRGLFSYFIENGKDCHFVLKFPDLEFATAFLSFVCIRHINKCKHLVFLKLKISATKKYISQILVKINWASFYGQWMQTLKTFRCYILLYLSVIGTLLPKLVLEISSLVLFSYAMHLIRMTFARISKTK